MSKTYTHTQGAYTARMTEDGPDCEESVVKEGEEGCIWFASFRAACLGSADRDEYVRVMCASIVERYERNAAWSQL